jgi:peroxiredoxin
MAFKYFKISFNFLVLILLFGCNKFKPNTFVLNGYIKKNYSGYIYLSYNSINDSCLVKNNKFYFKGEIFSTSPAMISTKRRTSAMEKNFYIEEGEISIDIEIQQKKIRDIELDWIVVKSIKGSKTAEIQMEFENYKTKFENDKNWQTKKYLKIEEIITKHPKSKYSSSLLLEESWDSDADFSKLKKLYKKLDLTYQDSSSVNILKSNLFPEESLLIGKKIIDFELPNENGKTLKTKDYRGKLLFVDFWASWCAPCREQMPKIKIIYDKYKNKKFKILAVSLDSQADEQKWRNAIFKENSTWDNVIDIQEFKGGVSKMYNIQSIPSNFLIDEQGIILDQNITPKQLETFLNNYYKN